MKKIRLFENQLYKLFEYRAQQRLPFKDEYGGKDYEFAEKNTIEHYIDWIEQFGKVGELEKSSIDFIQGIKLGFDKAFEWFKEKYGVYMYVGDYEKELNVSATKRKFYNKLGDVGFYKLSPEGGYSIGPEFNENGNMYVERVITLGYSIGDVPGYDVYGDLIDKYQNNVGGCWSWKKGAATAYCSSSSGSNVLLRGWIRLDDIDWVETVYINAYKMNNECEIRVKPNAKVELFDIKATYDGGKDFHYDDKKDRFRAYVDYDGDDFDVYTFDLKGRHIIVSSSYFGNNGKYDEDGYASIYDATSNEQQYMDRGGNIYKFKGLIKNKLSKCETEEDLKRVFKGTMHFGGTSLYLIRIFNGIINISFIYDFDKKEILNNQFYDDCVLLSGGYFKVKIGGKSNIILKNGEFYFNEWYDNVYLWNGCCVVENNGKFGIYKEGQELDLKYDDINRTINLDSDSQEFKDEFLEVKYNGMYNLLDWYNDRIVSPIWFGEYDYQVCKHNGKTVVEFYDNNSDMYIFVNVLNGEIIDKKKVLDL